MAKFNIFKIDSTKKEEFINNIYNNITNREIALSGKKYKVYLSTDITSNPTNLNWQFVLDQFGLNKVFLKKQPKGLLYIQINNDIFVATFGSAYFLAEKYCDNNFAFDIARKFKYEKIKSTSIANPNSNKNKVINSYLDSEYFEYDSGSAFIKIKAKLKLKKDFTLFDKNIEIGTSIKLTTKDDSLESFVRIIRFLNSMSKNKDKTPIPIFQEIKDINKINELNNLLKEDINVSDIKLSFSDFDIIGTTEFFYSQISKFRISYKRYSKDVEYLNIEEIKQFCSDKSLNLKDILFDLNISIIDNEHRMEEFKLIEFIDYTNDDNEAVIIKGKWYKYNNDYIQNLNKSLNDLPCRHLNMFNFYQDEYNEFINKQMDLARKDDTNKDISDEMLRKSLTKKFYKEMVYNKIMENKYKFINGDRSLVKVDGSRIEVDDLYKDKVIYAVKIGNSSGKLCYVVDQMDLAMKLLKSNNIKYKKEIESVALVLIIDKKEEYPLNDGKFNLYDIKYLALKNAINNWQKSARLLCFIPQVIVGYNS